MPDPIKPATTWQETQAQSFEALRAEANAQKAKRENLQPMELGKGRYKDIFKVGDRTRPELALRQTRPDGEPSGSGEVDLDTLIPKQALRDLADAYASANVGAMGEAMEGVRETITYDKDESEQLEWTGHPERHLLVPQAQEKAGTEAENAAFVPPDAPAGYERACDICLAISHSYVDDYECMFCTVDHNACCHDEEFDCCKNCVTRLKLK